MLLLFSLQVCYSSIRIQLKINVMQQSDNTPVLLFCPIAKLSCIPFHHGLYGKRMLNMEGIFVVFF